MNFRMIINLAFLVGGIFVVFRMIQGEYVQREKVQTQVRYRDRLRDITYSSYERKNNLLEFGLDEKMVAQTISLIEKYEKRYKRGIESGFDKVEAIDEVTKAFCGNSSDIRPRYAVAPYLILEKNGRRQVAEIRRSTNIEYNEWALSLDLMLMYQELELRADPKTDSTKMFYAALLSKKEDMLSKRIHPWGEGSSWKWKGVLRDSKDEKIKITEMLVEYFAIMHLYIERAQSSGGICEYVQ